MAAGAGFKHRFSVGSSPTGGTRRVAATGRPDAGQPHRMTPIKTTVIASYELTLVVNNPDVIERMKTPEWRSYMYTVPDGEEEAFLAEVLHRTGLSIDSLDGWADCDHLDAYLEREDLYELEVL